MDETRMKVGRFSYRLTAEFGSGWQRWETRAAGELVFRSPRGKWTTTCESPYFDSALEALLDSYRRNVTKTVRAYNRERARLAKTNPGGE